MERITRYEQLVAWQFASELADLVEQLVNGGCAARNWSARDQILKSSAKTPAQIAEGFLRYRPKESAYYYRIARASLGETKNHLLRGWRRGYWNEEQYKRASDLAEIAMKTTGGLLASRVALVKRQERKKHAARRGAAAPITREKQARKDRPASPST